MAPLERDRKASGGDLRRRVLSALVAAPVVVAAVWFGGPWLGAVVLACAGILALEWARLCCTGIPSPVAGPAVVASVLASVGAMAFGSGALPALAIAAVGGGVVAIVARQVRHPASRWLAVGVPYIAVPCIAFVWLRLHPDAGRHMVIWLLLVTWATDSAAYFVGRRFGGPRLAPRISPNKTWSGFCGGLAGGTMVGAGYYAAFGAGVAAGGPALWQPALAGLLVALAGSGGDLIESYGKRRFAVKDTGMILPGHGGLLDRMDSLLTAIPVIAALHLSGWRWL